MALRNYGVLTGKIVSHGPQAGGNPHYLLEVGTGTATLQAAINLGTPVKGGSDLLHVFAERMKGKALTTLKTALTAHGQADGLRLASQGAPTLDFVRGKLIEASHIKFTGDPTTQLAALAGEGGRVAIFGTGYPDQDDRPSARFRGLASRNPLRASFGFTGLDNVHMNQGSPLRVGNHLDRHFDENGPDQDGGILFFHEDGTITGYFARFVTQATQTDAHGNPLTTGVAELDAMNGADRKAVITPNRFAEAAPVPAATHAADMGAASTTRMTRALPADGRVFADPAPVDPAHVFRPDIDDAVRNSPDSKKFGIYGVPEPVPAPRGGAYPTMTLASVLGDDAVAAIQASGSIVFHTVGDTGSPDQSKLPNETSVADLMTQQQVAGGTGSPAFFFHLGDVVYYYGEQEYYYDQFYKPWKDYAAPIFAIPGNHDGITYADDMVSLEGFIAAFCDSEPRHWSGAGGIARTSMTQPGVYFTLDAPFVSIIGLYSNCSEHYGFLDDQQKLFLLSELQRLAKLRETEFRAVLVAVHHPPLSFSVKKASSAELRDSIDAAAKQAGLWPDAVFSGHAHLYQRVTRTVDDGGAGRKIPYIVCGAGGYGVNPGQEVDKTGFAQMDMSDPQFVLHRLVPSYGFLRVTVTPAAGGAGGTLRTEYFAPTVSATQPADVCLLDLATHQIL